jgi:hypothetical protein
MIEGRHDPILAALRESAAVLREQVSSRAQAARIPLERAELELARVVRIEMAQTLARAHDLVSGRLRGDASASANLAPDPDVRALQRDIAETIAVACSSGVPVPRILLRLAGDPATWPALERLARWAQRLGAGIGAGLGIAEPR